jgi:zinc protease
VTRSTRYFTLIALAVASSGSAGAQDVPKPASLSPLPKSRDQLSIPYEKYTLPNGMTVILSQDKSAPTLAVNVSYHVGSKNEVAGRTGFAHLFEHVMFTGSGHVPYGLHDRFTEGVGGRNNGTTNFDATRYYEDVPANYIEHALWLEADRMGWLLDALDTAKYNAQRSIVQQERKQGVDNQPFGTSDEIILANLYPSTHPYSWDVIGHLEDLQAAPIDAVKEFFRQYYAPNNATVSIVGDFDPAKTKALIRKYFGEVPRGKPIERPDPAPVTLSSERRLTYEDRNVTSSPMLFITWPTVDAHDDDRLALQVLGSVLFGSRTARVTKAIVYDRQMAAQVFGGQRTFEAAGKFDIIIQPQPGTTLTQLEVVTDSIIAAFKREGPTADEVARAKAGSELSFIAGLESNLGKAASLANSQLLYGDPSHGFTYDYPKLQAVTPEEVQRVARKYLTDGRVVLSVVPPGKASEASKPAQSRIVTGATGGSN